MNYERFYARVDLGAMQKNVAAVRNKVRSETKIMAVIKADAYGHGASAVAKYLDGCVDAFGVACVDEAVELRRDGCKKPLLVLGNADPCEYYSIVKNNVSPTVFCYDDAALLSAEAQRQDKTVKAHIKVDTGMGRIGGAPCEAFADEVEKISHLPNIELEGVFTHFACADEADKSKTEAQKKKFDAFIEMLERRGVKIPLHHADNSAGIMDFDHHYNMVRMGIILYGLRPSDETDREWKLYPAMELIGKITYIKNIEKGSTVSYGGTFVADRRMKIATVSVGYADGYPRSLSNRGCVLVRGVRCPVVGRVCMDQMMIDVSSVPNAQRGDDAVIVGKSGELYISADEVANAAGSFNYEFVCGISRRVARVYFDGDKYLETVSYIFK